MLAYYFPPHGGAGVQRTVKFLKHLPQLGYEPVVVTGPASTTLEWAPPDASMAEEIPARSRSSGFPARNPRSPGGFRGRAERWLGSAAGSRVGGWTGCREPPRLASDADVIYASMSPFETATAASRIAAAAGKPWVADLRDPWALDEWTRYPTALHRRLDLRRMREALASASAVILNTPEAERATRAALPELAGRLATIPNGWDADDFSEPVAPRADGEPFRIAHVGYVHDAPAGAGSHGRRDARSGARRGGLVTEARSVRFLLEAVRRVRAEGASRPIEVHLAGPARTNVSEEDAGFVVDHGYVSHAEAVALLRGSDLLFLPMHDLADGERSRTVPGKTYEYLASGTPILAALPAGDARDLLTGIPNAWLCSPRDVGCMVHAIREALDAPSSERAVPAIAAAYEREELTRRLAGVFDRWSRRTGRVGGAPRSRPRERRGEPAGPRRGDAHRGPLGHRHPRGRRGDRVRLRPRPRATRLPRGVRPRGGRARVRRRGRDPGAAGADGGARAAARRFPAARWRP